MTELPNAHIKVDNTMRQSAAMLDPDEMTFLLLEVKRLISISPPRVGRFLSILEMYLLGRITEYHSFSDELEELHD